MYKKFYISKLLDNIRLRDTQSDSYILEKYQLVLVVFDDKADIFTASLLISYCIFHP